MVRRSKNQGKKSLTVAQFGLGKSEPFLSGNQKNFRPAESFKNILNAAALHFVNKASST